MKNRRMLIMILSMIVLILVSSFYCNKYYYNKIDPDLLDTIWYKYNPLNGYYEKLEFKNNLITYNTNNGNYNNCTKYTYDKKNKEVNFDCDVKIKINKVSNNKINIDINNTNNIFFDNINDTLKFEFEKFYNKSLSEYKKEMNRVKDIKKINYSSLVELFNSDNISNVYIMGKNCNSIECTLVLEIIEKNMQKDYNIHYLNVDELTDYEVKELNILTNNTFKDDRDYYNGIYPRILQISKNRVQDEYDFICNGLSCNKYLKNK